MDNNSFFSLDRLVEFGLGMAMAQQMVEVMNKSINSVSISGVTTMNTPMPTSFFVALDGKSLGPLGSSELVALINQGRVNKNTLAWTPGMSAWARVENIPEILKLVALCPPKLEIEDEI